MLRSSSETTTTTSPTPISPFSTYSVRSEATSDELPDLGAFTTVFRALNHLHVTPRTLNIHYPNNATTTSTNTLSEFESDTPSEREGSTVWAQRPIASYLSQSSLSLSRTQSRPRSHSYSHSALLEPLDENRLVHEHATEGFGSSSGDEHGAGTGTRGGAGGSHTEAESSSRTVEIEEKEVDIEEVSDVELVVEPSLGYLDEALSFLASERERFAASRERSSIAPLPVASESVGSKDDLDSRKKRIRKRAKPKTYTILTRDSPGRGQDRNADQSETPTNIRPTDGEVGNPTVDNDALEAEEGDSSSSSSPHDRFKSTPATPRSKKQKRRQRAKAVDDNPLLSHSRSTPSLRLSLTIPPDPRILRLRSLAHKLRLMFPQDGGNLNVILSDDVPNCEDFVDPRGPVPKQQDTLVHVFIDQHSGKKPYRLSHAALALVLERGRPITRRVCVASSPLYQPMDTAEQLGYEVRVYARVPDLGGGADRIRNGAIVNNMTDNNNTTNGDDDDKHNSASNGLLGEPSSSSKLKSKRGPQKRRASFSSSPYSTPSSNSKGHVRRVSENTSTESETGNSGSGGGNRFPHAFAQSLFGGSSRPALATLPSTVQNKTKPAAPAHPGSTNSIPTSASARIRYREQGVDELLQLKLHQAIADVDDPPAGATIVLATGDGNVGQFNEDGFVGAVRTALKKGWTVELFAWEDGLSRAWRREFGGERYEGRFRVVEMEKFGENLAEV